MSFAQLKHRVDALGYKLEFSHSYANRYNPPACWDAAHYSIVDKRSGRSFAHVAQRNPNLAALQRLRLEALVVHNRRIVEI